MPQPSPLYRLLEHKIGGSLVEYVAARRATQSWREIAVALKDETGVSVSGERLRLWFADRITVEVRVA
jgi:hypothetical protein